MKTQIVCIFCVAVCLVQLSHAQEKTSNPYGSAYRNPYGHLPASPTVGDRMFADYFRAQSEHLTHDNLLTVDSKEAWESDKSKYRNQLFEMLGLAPMPPKSDLHATITRRIDREDFFVEMVHFQSKPGLYCTANVYVPKRRTKPAPAVL
jgi:hypothetical protein